MISSGMHETDTASITIHSSSFEIHIRNSLIGMDGQFLFHVTDQANKLPKDAEFTNYIKVKGKVWVSHNNAANRSYELPRGTYELYMHDNDVWFLKIIENEEN